MATSQELLASLRFECLPQLSDDQLPQFLQLKCANMLQQVFPAGHCAAIVKGQVFELRVLVKQQQLELLDPSIVGSHHLLIADGLRVVIADGEQHVELEQVYQLTEQLACKENGVMS